MFLQLIDTLVKKGSLPEKNATILTEFYQNYKKATGLSDEKIDPWFTTFIKFLQEQIDNPYQFEPYHLAIKAPFNYWEFGLELARPLFAEGSSVVGLDVVGRLEEALEKGENVIFLANHQTEMDPQIMGCMLEKTHPKLVDRLIFVAGQRVITDPLAIPFSMGCNLLCIYSRRYIDHDLETKAEKQEHNSKTMRLMGELLAEGGKCIYVAPSGGRDRRAASGKPAVAAFDPDSIEMFRLMARRSGRPCHFVPLALMTYDMLPPPETIEKELGEKRPIQKCRAHLYFGPPCDLESLVATSFSKHERRVKVAAAVHEIVARQYQHLELL